MLKVMNLVLHVFMMDIGGAGIILVIIISGVTMAVLSCMIVMNILTNYRFKFQINSYIQPSKDEIKAHWKNKQPFVYYGTAEYYVSDGETTIKQILKNYGMPFLRSSSTGAIKRIVSAEIRILPYKKHPVCYNIFFDDVGFAISLGTASFPK